jgi:hypothetical protein
MLLFRNIFPAKHFAYVTRRLGGWSRAMDSIIYLVGFVVILLFILSALGLR